MEPAETSDTDSVEIVVADSVEAVKLSSVDKVYTGPMDVAGTEAAVDMKADSMEAVDKYFVVIDGSETVEADLVDVE